VSHVSEQLVDLVLGDLPRELRAALEAHVGGCRECALEYVAVKEALAVVGWMAPEARPAPSVRARLLDDLDGDRYFAHVDRVADLLDLDAGKARALLRSLDDPRAWEPGPIPRTAQLHVLDAGPRVRGAYTGFSRIEAGVAWPRHRHLGQETMLVLAGGFRELDGHETHAGESLVMPRGSEHSFIVFDAEPCISAVVAFGGVEFIHAAP
jgi:hypothetical protein